ncbi:MAG: TolC family outer membrane protein [Alphaproteobacteria bacterium]
MNVDLLNLNGYLRSTAGHCRAVAFTAILLSSIAAAPAHAEGLLEALTAAYQTSPVLAAQRASLRATDETVSQALSGWRPQVTVSSTYGRQSIRTEQPLSFVGANRSISNDRQISPITGEIKLSQPIFRGGRTVNGVRQAEAGVMAGRELLLSTEQSVLLEAITAYMDVLRDEAVVDLNKNQIEVLSRQLQATQDRFRVGEITRTNVAQSEARLSSSVSNLTAAEATLIASKSAYEKVIGRQPSVLEPVPPFPPLPQSEEEAQAKALDSNPQLRAALEAERASDYAVKVEIGKLLPTVALEASARIANDVGAEGLEQDEAAITALLQVPLYQSGAQYAAVRQARETNSQRRLEAVQARRQVIEGVSNAWEGLRSTRARIVSDKEAVRANEIALEGVRQESDVGARTTLDALDAEQELLNARVALVRSNRNEVVAGYSLLSITGNLTASELGLAVATYDPLLHYNEVRTKLIGTRADTSERVPQPVDSPPSPDASSK